MESIDRANDNENIQKKELKISEVSVDKNTQTVIIKTKPFADEKNGKLFLFPFGTKVTIHDEEKVLSHGMVDMKKSLWRVVTDDSSYKLQYTPIKPVY